MALTNTIAANIVAGSKRMAVVNVAFDNSYTTGGLSFKPADVGMVTFDIVLPGNASGYQVQYDATAQKLKARTPTVLQAAHTHTGAAHTHNTDAHTHTENTAVSYTQNAATAANTPAAGSSTTPGAGSAAGAVTAAAGSEVANATDLSAVVVPVFVIGN